MEAWELAARESIRQLVARYNQCGDSGRIEEMLELFAEQATLRVPPDRVYRGRAAIRSLFDQARTKGPSQARTGFRRHFVATHQIDVTGEATARGRCYYAVLTRDGLDHWGRYVDEYGRLDGTWLFVSRDVSVDAAVEGGWGATTLGRLEV